MNALILIDCWSKSDINPFLTDEVLFHRIEKHCKKYIAPLVRYARNCGVAIVHADSGYPSLIRHLLNDHSIKHEETIKQYKKLNHHSLFYAGYCLDICVVENKCGMFTSLKDSFTCTLIQDATFPISIHRGNKCKKRLYKKGCNFMTIDEFKSHVVITN